MTAKTPDDNIVKLTTKFLKVDEENICLEFTKNEGDQLDFFEQFKTFKKLLGCDIQEEEGETVEAQ